MGEARWAGKEGYFCGEGRGKKFVLESGEGVQVKDLGGDLE
jgi:hypothetical protein